MTIKGKHIGQKKKETLKQKSLRHSIDNREIRHKQLELFEVGSSIS